MVPLIDFMKDVAVLIEKFWWGTTKSLKIAAFPDIPEHAQHQGFLGIMLLVLLFGKISYLTYEHSKVECLFVNI